MKLYELIPESEVVIPLSPEVAATEISSISMDSRTVEIGGLFICVIGAKFDAREFVRDACTRGVRAVICEHLIPAQELQAGVHLIQVRDIRAAASAVADRFYGQPSLRVCCYGVTGTSGKTSVAWLLSHALAMLGEKTLLGGTLGYTVLDPKNPSDTPLQEQSNTTIDPISVHRYLAEALRKGVKNAVFEATSQGSVQKRMFDVAWNGMLYTNLSRDHLDLHNSMEEYEHAKSLLFTRDLTRSPKANKFAIVNGDDPAATRAGRAYLNICPNGTTLAVTTSLGDHHTKEELPATRCQISKISSTASGLQFTFEKDDAALVVSSPLVGIHQVYNLATVIAALLQHGIQASDIERIIPLLPPIPGRVEPVSGVPRHIYIDYAHKPDALEKVLTFLKPLCIGRLISIIGCGGDRDRGKRPIMGEISSRIADITIVTSDNPRNESPNAIISEILTGVPESRRSNVLAQTDRRLAIKQGLALSSSNDLVVIAGKGHEAYQEINGLSIPLAIRRLQLNWPLNYLCTSKLD